MIEAIRESVERQATLPLSIPVSWFDPANEIPVAYKRPNLETNGELSPYAKQRRYHAKLKTRRLVAALSSWRSLVTLSSSSSDDPGTVSASLLSPHCLKQLGLNERSRRSIPVAAALKL